MNELKEQLKSIIQKQVNFSKLTYNIEIKVVQRANLERFPKHDIKICIKEEFINFREINQETKEIVKEMKLRNTEQLPIFIIADFFNRCFPFYRVMYLSICCCNKYYEYQCYYFLHSLLSL